MHYVHPLLQIFHRPKEYWGEKREIVTVSGPLLSLISTTHCEMEMVLPHLCFRVLPQLQCPKKKGQFHIQKNRQLRVKVQQGPGQKKKEKKGKKKKGFPTGQDKPLQTRQGGILDRRPCNAKQP